MELILAEKKHSLIPCFDGPRLSAAVASLGFEMNDGLAADGKLLVLP